MKVEEAIFWVGDHILSAFGSGSKLNFNQVSAGKTALTTTLDHNLSQNSLPLGQISELFFDKTAEFTRLEQFFIHSLETLIAKQNIPLDENTIIILSSTKGNIGLLANPAEQIKYAENQVLLSEMAKKIGNYLGVKNPIIIVSNACVSGSLAISVARRLLQNPKYQRALVTGGDELSRFIVSGFESFHALSDQLCKPFDKDRKGLNLGEAIATVYLTKDPNLANSNAVARITGVGSYNDANHISGPSRTGEGLYRSIKSALKEAGNPKLDFISAHGTATLYNDEMEAIALDRCGLNHVPVNSYKGYFGHTLGASGLLESILSIHAAKNNCLIPSLGFDSTGTSKSLAVITDNRPADISNFMKLASGFGGCNTALIFTMTNV